MPISNDSFTCLTDKGARNDAKAADDKAQGALVLGRGKSTTYYADTDPRNLINPETGELYDVQAGDC